MTAETQQGWHRFSTTGIDGVHPWAILQKANADYKVEMNPVEIYDWKTNTYSQLKDRYVTGLRFADESLVNMEVVKNRYEIVPNIDVLEKAISVAEHSDEHYLDSVGIIEEGKKFFAVVGTGTLEPTYESAQEFDKIRTHIVFTNSHDGSWPIMIYALDTSCGAVMGSGSLMLDRVHYRHTPNWQTVGETSTVEYMMEKRGDWSYYYNDLRDSLHNMVLSKEQISERVDIVLDQKSHAGVMVGINQILTIRGSTYTGWNVYTSFCRWVDMYRNVDSKLNHILDRNLSSYMMKCNFLDTLVY